MMNFSVISGQFLIVILCYANCKDIIYLPKYDLRSYELTMNKKEIYPEHLCNYEHQYIADIPHTTRCQIVITDDETKRQFIYDTFDKNNARLIYQCITKVSIRDVNDTKGLVSTFDFDFPNSAFDFMGDIVRFMEYQEQFFDFEMELESYNKKTGERKLVVFVPVTFKIYDNPDYDYMLCSFQKKPGDFGNPKPYLTFGEGQFVMFTAKEPDVLIIHIDIEPDVAYLVSFKEEDDYKAFKKELSYLSGDDKSVDVGETIPLASEMVVKGTRPATACSAAQNNGSASNGNASLESSFSRQAFRDIIE